jgi:hypothetical protein
MSSFNRSARFLVLFAVLLLCLLSGGGQTPRADAQGPVGRAPTELRLIGARQFTGDLRQLPYVPIQKVERPERDEPPANPVVYGNSRAAPSGPSSTAAPLAPAPAPIANFAGLDFAIWGAGHPPDTNGDVGPTYFIQTVNTSIGIFRKSDGVRVAAFTYNTFMSQGRFGNLCDTNNFGDPYVLYDTFEDRWIISDFAFTLDGSNNVINPPGNFQCFAASKSGDPVAGGWNFYSINTSGGLGDYPKLGIWPDGVYMSVNMFAYPAGGSFQNVRVYAFNKAQMYAGTPTVQSVSFDAPSSEFTLLPANARLQTGTPPAGSPNYFASVWNFLNVVGIWKFHVDWNSISTSSFTGPFNSVTATSWSQYTLLAGTVPSPANRLDTLYPRLMVQNQYSNSGGVESLWDSHTVGPPSGDSSTQSAIRYYQVKVTGGTVETNATQAFTYSPDTTLNRFMPSAAVDRAGDMAIGYSTSNATTNPAIKYAGRLAGDAANSITQGEQLLIQGAGSQSGNCGSSACTRWGDYSAMSLDPDGCTFWYTNEYYDVTGLNDLTRIGSFAFPSCTPVGSGTVLGTVIKVSDSTAISGAVVQFGSRMTTTNGSGFYQFLNIPAGTYPSITANYPGFNPGSAGPIIATTGVTTTQNFSLSAAAASRCFVDTSQADFQTGVPTNCDLTASPGDVVLLNAANIDQQNLSVTNSGFGFTSLSWAGQTFQPAVTGQLTRVDLDLFCSTCTGTTPNVTVSIRATSGDLPTGSDLAVATIPGFSSGAGGLFEADFGSPAALTAGTRYAVIFRAVSNPSAGTYAYVISTGSPYANGRRVTSVNSGSTWTGQTTDLGFKTYMKTGFAASGDFVSSLKDANPLVGYTPNWTTLSWTASVTTNTSLKFQAAASNNAAGPFNFVGPDGTTATFFTTSGASLAQFNNARYLKYKAYLTTSDSSKTVTVNDVTVCFINQVPTAVGIDKFEISSISSSAFTSSEALIAGGALALCGAVAGLWLVRRRPK